MSAVREIPLREDMELEDRILLLNDLLYNVSTMEEDEFFMCVHFALSMSLMDLMALNEPYDFEGNVSFTGTA